MDITLHNWYHLNEQVISYKTFIYLYIFLYYGL